MRYLSLFLCFLVFGCCPNRQCIEIKEGYQGVRGHLVYCFHAERSKEVGRNVFVSTTGHEAMFIDADDAAAIIYMRSTREEHQALEARAKLVGVDLNYLKSFHIILEKLKQAKK